MAEFPIDPEYGRNEAEDEQSVEVTLEDEETPEVEELSDGSAVVTIDFKTPQEDEDFYENLADKISMSELDSIAGRYLELIDEDKQARSERDKQYEEGLKRTGLGNDAPGGATFMGASKVVHPVMAEACVDFASRAIKELFPPDGPVRTNILGDVDEKKLEIAERKRDFMNWQLTEQIEEFKDEQEQLLTQLPLGGSQFLKLWYDEKLRRPCAEFIPIDKILLPFASNNFYTSQRVTEINDITEWEYNQRVARGLYRDVKLFRSSIEPEQTSAQKANDKIEGKKSSSENKDGLRIVYHIYTWLELEEDGRSKGESAPYIMMVDEAQREVIGLYRNWEEGDETLTKLDWLIEFKFIPWRGAYAIGLPHLIGGLAAALTGALRALLDSAHINNAATMLKLKGARISGSSQQVEVTQVAEIEGAPGVDDIRKIAMPFPFNPPSQVLYQLLGFLQNAAKGVVTTSEEKIADITSNAPVGTTQALIEQGAAVFSAIHSRLHDSQRRVLAVLQRINRWYLNEQRRGDIVAELPIQRDDFKRRTDVVPVSDPHIFSETQRMAQNQALLALSEKYPDIIDRRVAVQRTLKQMKVPNIQELMPQYMKPVELHAADENSAMAMGRMAVAYPRQDHLAHIASHLAFGLDPMLGSNPIVAPAFVPRVLDHIKQHMMLWYAGKMTSYAIPSDKLKGKKYAETQLVPEIDRSMMLASGHMAKDSEEQLARFMPGIQKLLQIAQQMSQQAPQQPLTPDAQAVLQASMAETQRRSTRDQADIQLKALEIQKKDEREDKKLQFEAAMNVEDNLTRERIETVDQTIEAARLKKEQGESALALQQTVQRNLGA
jgi:hypothetical protein